MYYIPLALMYTESDNPNFHLSFKDWLKNNQIPATLGNIVGASACDGP